MKSTPMLLAHDHSEDMGCYKPAGFVLRWYALTLDVTFFAPIDVLVHMPFNRTIERYAAYGQDVRAWVLTSLLVALPLFIYVIAPTALSGQTLGKRIVGLKVIRDDGGVGLSLETVLLRETVGKLLSLASFGLGFVAAGFGNARALHDYVGKTRVISYKD